MNNNSSSTAAAATTTANNSRRHCIGTYITLHSNVRCSIASMPRDIQPKKYYDFFEQHRPAGKHDLNSIFCNRSSLLLNFTRNEFGNGTSTVEHDYRIRLFQVILNFMNRSCFFLCSIIFVSYRIVSHTRRAIPILNQSENGSYELYQLLLILIHLEEDDSGEAEIYSWLFLFIQFSLGFI